VDNKKITDLSGVTPCNLIDRYQHSSKTCCLHLIFSRHRQQMITIYPNTRHSCQKTSH